MHKCLSKGSSVQLALLALQAALRKRQTSTRIDPNANPSEPPPSASDQVEVDGEIRTPGAKLTEEECMGEAEGETAAMKPVEDESAGDKDGENVESEKEQTVAVQALRMLKDILAAGQGVVGKGD